jgi:hypothetical protein
MGLRPRWQRRFGGLDPQRRGVVGPRYRRILVDRLIELAQHYELLGLAELDLSGLAYEGVERRLLAVLNDPVSTVDPCYLAVRITRANALTGMNDALVTIALDDGRPVVVRPAAGDAAMKLVPPTTGSPLTALADPARNGPGDEDELFGIGLRALLRSGTSPADLLPALKPAENPDLYGSYRSFLPWACRALSNPVACRPRRCAGRWCRS